MLIVSIKMDTLCDASIPMQNANMFITPYHQVYSLFKEVVCLVPQDSRRSITITIPKKIENQEILYNSFTDSLQSQYSNFKVYVMSIRCNHDELYQLEMGISRDDINDKQYAYDIVYLIIPKELIYKFESEHINCIKYYVGTSKNNSEFIILDKPPTLDMISVYENDKPLPFSWRVNMS